ncbi:hypothetical protein [Methylobacterium nodulans]|uniref:hypothetical protein n=1 Tax=Methylobacterium nodulans TaxID=114616 RepID=UPI003137D62F
MAGSGAWRRDGRHQDAKDCTRETAQDIITALAHSPQECLLMGPLMVAGPAAARTGPPP